MDQSKSSSRRMLWIITGVVAIVVLVVAATLFLMMGTTKKEAAVSPKASSGPVKVATKEDVQQSLATLDATIKQADADQAAAKAAITDGTSQIKVGS